MPWENVRINVWFPWWIDFGLNKWKILLYNFYSGFRTYVHASFLNRGNESSSGPATYLFLTGELSELLELTISRGLLSFPAVRHYVFYMLPFPFLTAKSNLRTRKWDSGETGDKLASLVATDCCFMAVCSRLPELACGLLQGPLCLPPPAVLSPSSPQLALVPSAPSDCCH